jgi:PAS domain-containing protein
MTTQSHIRVPFLRLVGGQQEPASATSSRPILVEHTLPGGKAREASCELVIGSDGMIRAVSSGAEHLLGRPASELIGQPFEHPFTPGRPQIVEVARAGDGTVVTGSGPRPRSYRVRTVQFLPVELLVRRTWWNGEAAFLASLREVQQHAAAA